MIPPLGFLAAAKRCEYQTPRLREHGAAHADARHAGIGE
jgi:hypothetical protein